MHDTRAKRLVSVVAAVGCGLAGALIVTNTLRVQPVSIFSVDYSATMIFMVVIGGIGRIEGPLLGAVVYYLLQENLADFGTWYLVIVGAVAIAITLLAPKGVWEMTRDRVQLFPVGHRVLDSPPHDRTRQTDTTRDSDDKGDPMEQMDGRTDAPELAQLYRDFEANKLAPLWTQRDDLRPFTPVSKAVPFVWRWKTLYDIAQRSGELVPVGRGGERRAIGLANPTPVATSCRPSAASSTGCARVPRPHRGTRSARRSEVAGHRLPASPAATTPTSSAPGTRSPARDLVREHLGASPAFSRSTVWLH